MKVVLDTNIILSALPLHADNHLIIEQLIAGKYKLLISTEIYFEYVEILSRRGSPLAVFLLESAILKDENIQVVEIHYSWNLIPNDPDDNKFVDCAIAGNADFLVTNDNHFNSLKNLEFPKLMIISLDEFLKILNI